MATAQSVMMTALGIEASRFHSGIDAAKAKVDSFDKRVARSTRTLAGMFSIHLIAQSTRALSNWARELRQMREDGKDMPSFISDAQLQRIGQFEERMGAAMTRVKGVAVSAAAAATKAWEMWWAGLGGAVGELMAGEGFGGAARGFREGAEGVDLEDKRQFWKRQRVARDEAAAKEAADLAEKEAKEREREVAALKEGLPKRERALMDAESRLVAEREIYEQMQAQAREAAGTVESELAQLRAKEQYFAVVEAARDVERERERAAEEASRAEKEAAEDRHQTAMLDADSPQAKLGELRRRLAEVRGDDLERARIEKEIRDQERTIAKDRASAARARLGEINSLLPDHLRPDKASRPDLSTPTLDLNRPDIARVGGQIGGAQIANVAGYTKQQLEAIKTLLAEAQAQTRILEGIKGEQETTREIGGNGGL